MKLHKCITWTSLWIRQPTTSLGGRAREYLQFLGSDDLVCPRQVQCHPNVGRVRINLLLPLVGHMWLLPNGCNLFDLGSRRSCPHCLSVGGSWGNEDLFSTTCTVLFLRLDRGSFFFNHIFAYLSWLNLVGIPTKRKRL